MPQGTLSSRERVRLALEHRETDRIPIAIVCAGINPPARRELEIQTRGKFVGIGADLYREDGILTVATPLEDSPALAAGIRPQDKLLMIDGKWATEVSSQTVLRAIRGPKGSEVTLTVFHSGDDAPHDIAITRDEVSLKSVWAAQMVDEERGLGYIRLVAFRARTAQELEHALKRLEGRGLRALILDLRGNRGGLLTAATAVTNKFVDEGVIVTMKSRLPRLNVEYLASGKTRARRCPLVILVDGGSASASEILAGAVRDHGRGTLIGTKTRGKGSVQGTFILQDGHSAIHLTIARYYPPSGEGFDGEGLEPDVVQEVDTSEAREIAAWRQRAWADANLRSAQKSSRQGQAQPELRAGDIAGVLEVDGQLRRAVEYLSRRGSD